ncbi:MAG: nuclear transport factor 2 family protein [Myxococcales bacterium]|nr:nuclear transport factor 2 family protein [Myxococcales bacterium]
MSRHETEALLRRYYAAFDAGDMDTFLSLLTDDVVHVPNQGGSAGREGKAAFAEFMAQMNRCYRERVKDLVVFATEDGRRGAAELVIEGTYLSTDAGLPEAKGQTYELPVGAFFELRDGKVARVTNYYDLERWLAQVTR